MATAKHRTTKRSSGGPYASTVTTVIFVCIFIFGVWMLTSNSYVSSNKSTTRLSQGTSSQTQSRKIPIETPAFEDNPGDLPEDAIRPDDGSAARIGQHTGSNETKPQVETATGMEVDKQPHVQKEEKYEGEEVQLSEESTVTQNQSIEGIPTVDHTTTNEDHRRKGDHQEKTNDKRDKLDAAFNEEHGIMEEDEENRMGKDHNQQEQPQKEEASEDQIRNKEKPIETHPAKETKPSIKEAKIQPTIIAPTNNSKAAAGDIMMVDQSSSGISKEFNESKKEWKTQADQSDDEKERRADAAADYKWELCNVRRGTDYIPCLDNAKAIRKLPSRSHFEHRERHCPEEGPICLVPIPEGYRTPF